jgi:hypothetical protein
MYIQNDIPGEAEVVEALRGQWNAALKVRDTFPREAGGSYQEGVDSEDTRWSGKPFANADPGYAVAQAEVLRISDEMDKARRSYFRLNIWGMARYRDVMDAVGMGYWAEHPEWDGIGEYPSQEHAWAAQEALSECNGDVEAALAYAHGYDGVELTMELIQQARFDQEASDAVRRAHPGETPGIPLVKFTSNDGWLVTPVECSSALQLFGEFIRHGYGSEMGDLHWQEALTSFRKADDAERQIVAMAALQRRQVVDAKVGHDTSSFGGQQGDDDRPTVAETVAEPYFLQWLDFLETGVHFGGFAVH